MDNLYSLRRYGEKRDLVGAKGRNHNRVDMCSTCKYADRMPIMVQIRNVPSDLHRELKARAALEGMSLSDYLLRELRHALDRPTLDEMRKRLSRRQSVQPHPPPAAAVRAERNSR
jgi:plasmid stability protein